MAHELPPQYRAALNPREPTAHRIDRLWALQAELSTPHGLLHAAAWLPPAWPHLLQLLSDPQPDLRAAAATLLGQLGALLATGREPRLAGRLPPGALLDWALALLPPGSTLPAAQRMSVETKEAALTALHICVAALPPAALGPHAQPLLRLTCALLEAASTPPRLLGPLLRLLLGVLPTVPLAALGQGFSDLADLLCGWALEPLVATADRQLITLVLHALRPQWHSHPDLTASLTENMLNDVKSAMTALQAAAGARPSSAQEPPAGGACASLATSAASCMQLIALLSDIVSAASLRQLATIGDQTAKRAAGGAAAATATEAAQGQGQRGVVPIQQRSLPMQQQQASAGQSVLLVRSPHQHPTPQQQQHPYVLHPHQRAQSLPLQHQNPTQSSLQQQYSSNHNQQPQFSPAVQQLPQQHHHHQMYAAGGGPTAALAAPHVMRPSAPPPSPPAVALPAILATRPGASTVRHLLDLYRRFLPIVQDVRQIVCKLDGASTVTRGSGAERSDPWVSRLCGCVEMLAQSITSCIDGIDPRDLNEVWDVVGSALAARLEQLSLDATPGVAPNKEPSSRAIAVLETSVGQPAGSGASAVLETSVADDVATAATSSLPSTLGVVGSAIAACAPEALSCAPAPQPGQRQAMRPTSATGLSASGEQERRSTSPTAEQRRQQQQQQHPPPSTGFSHAAAMRAWVYHTALDWTMSGLSGVGMGACGMEVGGVPAEASKPGEGLRAAVSASSWGTGPGPDAEILIGCVMRLLERVGQFADPRSAGRLLVATVLEGDGVRGVRGLRSSPNVASVTTAAKLLHALMAETDLPQATTTLHWLLADLRNNLSAPPSPPATVTALTAPSQPTEASAPPPQAASDVACAVAMAFTCAVLQAAVQRGLLSPHGLLLVEAVASAGLIGGTAVGDYGHTVHFSASAITTATTISASPAAADAATPSLTLSRHPWEAALATAAPAAGSLPLALSTSLTDATALEAPSQLQSPLPTSISVTGAASRTQSVTLLQSPPQPQALPASLTAALLDTWSVSAVALLGALPCGDITAPGAAAAEGRQGSLKRASASSSTAAAVGQTEEGPSGGLATPVHAGYAAYLRSLHMLQQQAGRSGGDAGGSGGGGGGSADGGLGAGAAVQLRVVAALRRLLQHSSGFPATSPPPPLTTTPSGMAPTSLRSEALLTLASDLLVAGMTSLDSGVRAAATDCAAKLVSHVLQPSPSPSPLPTAPPAAFHTLLNLALDTLNDSCPAVAANAANLAVQLTEPGLLVLLAAAASVTASSWVPPWQDELAVAPQRTAPRPQQVARLLELVFQSAAAPAATATGGSVLLRKRAPNAGLGGGSQGESGSEGEASGWRLEALQRLAASLVPVVEEGGEGGGAGGGTDLYNTATAAAEAGGAGDASADARMAAMAALSRSGAAAVWLAVQEGAKQLVVSRLRTHLGGPTQTLGALERMLQVTYSRLVQERRESGPAAASASGGGVSGSSRDAAWLALELLGAIERAVAHAAEGLPPGREHLPQPVLAFYAANRKVCEEWFTRVRELLARTASLSSAHHHTLHHGLMRLRDIAAAQRQLMASLARERTAAAAAAAAVGAAVASPARKGATAAEGMQVEAGGTGGAGGSAPTEATATAVPSGGGRHGSKQVQRGRAGGGAAGAVATKPAGGHAGGHQQQKAQQGPIAGASVPTTEDAGVGAAGGGGSGGLPALGAAASQGVSQLEGNLSRLALGVVELLKMVGGAMLATGEADSLQGLHTWAVREFEPLLRGAHLPGASALAAATAPAAAEPAQSDMAGVGPAAGGARSGAGGPGSAGPGAKRRSEGNRASSRGSGKQQHKDAFAWLHAMSLQAAGSYEQALLAYNAFLAPSQPSTSTPSPAATPVSSSSSLVPGSDTAPTTGTTAAAELYAAAQAFVVERVGECYAALSDWSGLQGLMGAFSRAATAGPTVAGWWPAAAASLEHRFMSLAAYDTAQGAGSSVGGSGSRSSDTVPTHPTSLLIASLRALEATTAAAAPSTSALSRAVPTAGSPTSSSLPAALQPTSPLSAPPPSPSELRDLRNAVSTELTRQVDRLRASSLSDPAVQREALLHAACLRNVLRGLQAASVTTNTTANPSGTTANAGGGSIVPLHVDGPWRGLLQPAVRKPYPGAEALTMGVGGGSGGGLGRLLLTPEGTLQHGVLRDVAVTSALLRAARGTDPRVSLSGTRALSLEHVRAAAAGGNWGLASRLVAQSAAASAAAAVVSVSDAGSPVSGGAGERVVLSVVQSLITASAGRLLPGQVVELQLRTLLPHMSAVAVTSPTAATASTTSGLHASLRPAPSVNVVDADNLACALCTLSRWMLKASGNQTQPQQQHNGISPQAAPNRQTGSATAALPNVPSRQPHQLPPPGFNPSGAAARSTSSQPPPTGPSQSTSWTAAAEWQILCGDLLAQLTIEYGVEGGRPGGPLPAFALPVPLLQACYAPAAACLRALQLSRGLARAWKAWADLVYRATKDIKARGNIKPLLTQQAGSPGGKLVGQHPPVHGAGSSGGTTNTSDSAGHLDVSSGVGVGSHGDVATAGYGAAAVAYCRFLSLSYEGYGGAAAVARPEDVLPVLLQLLHIIMRYGCPLEALLTEQLAAVPPRAWAAVTPQLLAQLSGAAGAARRLLAALLHAVGRVAPSLVLYPAVVEVRAADAAAACGGGGEAAVAAADAAGGGALVPELRLLLADLGRSRPGLLAGVEVLVGEMERLTVLWDERWAALLAEVEVEIARRAVSLQAEAARVADDASLTPDQRQALLASRYATLMAPAVLLLERQLRVTAASPPYTPAERRFTTEMLPRLRAATAALRDGAGVRDWARPQPAWTPLRAAAAALARQQRQPLPPMSQLSPRLAALVDTEVPLPGVGQEEEGAAAGGGSGSGWMLPMPWAGLAQAPSYNSYSNSHGQYHNRGTYNSGVGGGFGDGAGWTGGGVVTVAGVCGSVSALPTKTRPKRAALLGSDGATYTYLLKGREDLRMDERLMQVLRTVNVLLRSDPATAAHDLPPLRHYSVTPLGPRAGLIQWVPATTSLFAIFRHWQTATQERHAAMVAARVEGAVKAAAEGAPAPAEVEPPPAAAVSRPMDLFYAKLVAALQERGLSSATPRRDWPFGLLLTVYAALRASAPTHLLARTLWAGGGSAAASWRRQQRFARSLAAASCVGHLLGLGDRHPDNMLLEGRGAGVVHIDYNVCWDKGAKLRVPEVMPFRLTPMLVAALGVGGLPGAFRAACEAVLGCLRRRREGLVGLVDAVLSDRGVDWAVEREDAAARQDMELAVALNLFVSRAEEAKRQLDRCEEDLAALSGGPLGALLSYVEAHALAEALRNASGEAQQRIQQAKAALEAAGRAEAEAAAVLAGAAQEAASLAAEASSLRAAVPALLQQCGAWAQQHTGALGVLRDSSFLDGTAVVSGSCFSWRAVESGAALGLLAAVAGPGPAPLTTGAPLALLPAAVGGEGSTLGLLLPEALLLTCHECDRQLCELLPRREAALAEAISALTQYGTIVRRLLPLDYPGASYHHRWATALAVLAAGGLTLPAVAQAQALAPREPRLRDVAASWQTLRGAHRLAAAAAAVLAPTSADGAAALAGQLASGVRVPGRELAPTVAGAGRALAEAQAGAAARFKASAAAAGLGQAGEGSVEGLVGRLLAALQKLRRRGLRAHKERQETAGLMYDYSEIADDEDGTAAGAAVAATGLLRLVRATEGRLKQLHVSAISSTLSVSAAATPSELTAPVVFTTEAVPASCLSDFVSLTGEVFGLAAAATAIADAKLAAAVFGDLAQQPPPSPQYHGGGAAASALAPVGHCPLPWLATAAGMAGRWAELQQRLAADVGPELAGQLHVSGSGAGPVGAGAGTVTGGAAAGSASSVGGSGSGTAHDTPLTQAAADLVALTRPVEEALAAGADARRRLEALAELVASYGARRAELFRRAGRNITSDGMSSQVMEAGHPLVEGEQADRAAAEAELAELDAAWAARDATAVGLTAAAAAATEALVEALRRWYVGLLGPSRLPGEILLAVKAASGSGGAMAYSGGESWTEAGGVGHAAVAALARWWEQVSEMEEGLPEPQVVAEAEEDADGAVDLGAVRCRWQLPPVLRLLWRCVDVVRHVGASLRACLGLRLTAPAGTDGALTEAYAAVLRLLVRHAATHAAAVLLPRLKRHFASLRTHLTAAVQHYQQRQRQLAYGDRTLENGGEDDGVAGGYYGSRRGLSSARGRMMDGQGWTNGDRDTAGDGEAAAEGEWAAGALELVPFTDFDSQAPGEGELLGGLEDDEEEEDVFKTEGGGGGGGVGEEGEAAWDGGDGDEGGYGNGGGEEGGRGLMPACSGDGMDGGEDETGEGYVIDLGLDLDLDDGFGADNDEGAGDEGADGGAGGNNADEAATVGNGMMAGGPETAGRQVAAAPAANGASTSPRHTSPALCQKQDRQHQQLQQQQHEEDKVCRLMELLAATLAAGTATSTAIALDPSSSISTLASPLLFHPSWPAGPDARATRAARLQRLAAFEWLHEHHLLQAMPAGNPRVGQALAQYFATQAAPDPLQPSVRMSAPNRLALLTALQSAVDALPGLEAALGSWESASGGAVAQVMGALGAGGGGGASGGGSGVGGMGHGLGVDGGLVAQRAGALMARRQQWLAESRGVVVRVCQVSEALLQFEYSRQGITWASGGAAVADSFAPHGQLLGRAEVLARLTAGGGEAGRQAAVAEASQRAAEAARQAADARYAMEVAQYEEVSASSQLQAHLPQLVSRSLDLGPALVELEPYVRGLKALLMGKLGLALKELSAVSAQHSAAADVASVAAVVSSYYERASQAAEALAAALPDFTTALAVADAAAPLPEDMASEIGFLSAQLLGGPAAAAVTLERANAMLTALAAPVAALQPSVHLVSELPHALSALSSELTALASASTSIAAAVESKHLLPPLDEQPPSQQQQPQSQPHQPSGGSGEPGGPLYSEPSATPAAGHVVTGEVVTAAAAAGGTGADSIPSGAGGGGGVGDVAGTTPDNADTTTAAAVGAGVAGSSSTGMVTNRSTARASVTTVDKGGSESGAARDLAASMPVRQASNATVPATAAASLQQHRYRRSAADEARRRAFAAGALRRFVAKLEGREVDAVVGGVGAGAAGGGAAGTPALSVGEQVELLIRQATSEARLAVMYEGWAAWL